MRTPATSASVLYSGVRVCIHVYSLWSLQSVCMILRGPCFQSQPESTYTERYTEPRPGNDIDNSDSAAYAVPSTVLLLHPFSGVKGATEGHYLLWFGAAHSCCTVCRPGICSPGRLHACFTNQCPLRASQHTAHACGGELKHYDHSDAMPRILMSLNFQRAKLQ